MNFFKKLMLLSLIFSVVGLTTCKDEECVAPEVSENIIGIWNTTLSTGEVEFKSDGTLIDPDDVIIGIGAGATKTYSISGNTLTVSASGSGSSISTEFEISQNECDQIKISILGIVETLNRK